MEYRHERRLKMNKKVFNIIGWTLLLSFPVIWLIYGHMSWLFVLLLGSYLCFSIENGKIKKLKWLSASQIILLVVSFLISVAIAFGLIQLAYHLINSIFHLQGALKTMFEWISSFLSLIIVLIPFGSIINRIDNNIEEKMH